MTDELKKKKKNFKFVEVKDMRYASLLVVSSLFLSSIHRILIPNVAAGTVQQDNMTADVTTMHCREQNRFC